MATKICLQSLYWIMSPKLVMQSVESAGQAGAVMHIQGAWNQLDTDFTGTSYTSTFVQHTESLMTVPSDFCRLYTSTDFLINIQYSFTVIHSMMTTPNKIQCIN